MVKLVVAGKVGLGRVGGVGKVSRTNDWSWRREGESVHSLMEERTNVEKE